MLLNHIRKDQIGAYKPTTVFESLDSWIYISKLKMHHIPMTWMSSMLESWDSLEADSIIKNTAFSKILAQVANFQTPKIFTPKL